MYGYSNILDESSGKTCVQAGSIGSNWAKARNNGAKKHENVLVSSKRSAVRDIFRCVGKEETQIRIEYWRQTEDCCREIGV